MYDKRQRYEISKKFLPLPDMSLKIRNIFSLLIAFSVTAFLFSCSNIDPDLDDSFMQGATESQNGSNNRVETPAYRNVFLIYSCGFNDLSSYLKNDIKEITENFQIQNSRDALLIFSHNTAKNYDYKTPSSPTLTHIYKDKEGLTVKDTLMVMNGNDVAADSKTLNKILTFVNENFPASVYGMLFSSHGSGWAPAKYIYNPNYYEGQAPEDDFGTILRKPRQGADDKPLVKSVGMHLISYDKYTYPYPYYEAHEINITDFAQALPMKLDYLIFDACLMGGVETAYQLRGKCDILIASQAEILADGMDYKTMSSYIFDSKWPDYVGFCENYYNYYNEKSGQYQSATISMIDCNKLEPLAEVCKDIFSSCRSNIALLEGSRTVQGYFREEDRSTLQWYYDLEDIAINAEASMEQLSRLSAALNDCVLYKNATEKLLGSRYINHHCGLSMYLPFKKKTYLNTFYKTLDWNKVTGLVE